MRTMSSSAMRASCTVSLRSSSIRFWRNCRPLNSTPPATSSNVRAINTKMRVTILMRTFPGSPCASLSLIVTDTACDIVGADYIGRLVLDPFRRRIRPLEINPSAPLLETHIDDEHVRFGTVGILDVQEVAADKRRVAAMGLVHALVVVTENVELAVDETVVTLREIGERLFLSGLLDVGCRAFGQCPGLLGSSRARGDRSRC